MSDKPSTSKPPEDVLQFLDSLDTYNQKNNSAANLTVGKTASGNEAPKTVDDRATDTQSVLDFLDQFTQTTSSSTADPTTITTSQVSPVTNKIINDGGLVNESLESKDQATTGDHATEQPSQSQQRSGSWSWGGLLATASTAYKTATTVVDTSVKGALATVETVRVNESTKKFEERVRGYVNKETIGKIGADLKTLSLSTINTVVNAVAPPIAEHEVVEVWLAHDMVGYIGVESLVYRAFMKVMEQVEGGDIVMRKGNESKRRDSDAGTYRDLNFCEGFVEAVGLATATIEQIIKENYTPSQKEKEKRNDSEASSLDNVVTTCPVFMSIQPTKANPYNLPSISDEPGTANHNLDPDKYLFYVIVLADPTHKLNFKTFSQSLPISWLDIPYEENEWVEEKMVESLKLAVQAIAQDYVWARMTGDGKHPPPRVEVPIIHV
ncbi:hypothetical protein G9A89_023963 [Geosiphon pyriformis]|nr:hypothetical protein G9A89_023963 [Geosiphon pyriformis]